MIIWTPRQNAKRSFGNRGGKPEPRGPMATRRGAEEGDANIRTAIARHLPALAGVVIGLGLIGAGWYALGHLPRMPVTELVVHGKLDRVDAEALRLNALPDNADVLTLDLNLVRERVKALPWVRDVEVRRIPPGRIELAVEEHQPLAIWQEQDRSLLVNTKSEVFNADHDLQLPLLAGPPGTAPIVVAEAARVASVLGEVPAEVRLSDRRAWSVRLGDNTRIELGREETLARLERFARVRQDVVMLKQPGLRVDLRYPAGLAIQKTPEMLQYEKEQASRKKKA
ncbi:MAG: cell division protein FtsQ/DivIB [Burkholderiales bacterium]|nr:cell division protein FtsQ/DivIB [Burkholderiales bacterium]